ncbi:MAG: aromatic ring-hydroxylating dioxygenase subunit alpha [Immundisolibacter sp.]|uniref:aromatic ring-hydroxylating oxygenase subunit alpha n=1 Tax=Immundisolibacter sp. TaxID=1934948 RepID=UPI00199F7710|nr:aromatic ring-hydroxylating dioxygenase subunit alpha [Immundisolibacter sp.]MBC7162339.1 aromatic ring-hydroxylating dioxygenase subunit alpha [Immundisolibacter sp.]
MNSPANLNPRPFAPRYPQLGTGPVPVSSAVDPAFFELERERIFRGMWVNLILREEDLPKPGDYFVRYLEAQDASILVVRGDDGKLRAFHNVCTHRGNQLAEEGAGHCKGFQCNFHGWTFDTRGRLAFVTDEQRFHNLDKSALGLPAVHLDTWRGFIFVNLAKRPAQTLELAMAEFNQDLKPFPFEQMVLAGRYRYAVNANWKVTMNAFQESYHGAFVHKLSVGQCISPEDPYLAVQRIKLQENGNQSVSVHLAPHDLSPAEKLAFGFGATFTQGGEAAQAFPGTAQAQVRDWGFDLNIIFPYSRINVGAGWYYVDAFWPVAHDKTVYELAYYFPMPQRASEMISQEYSKIVLRDLSREDLATNEATHRSLRSGAIRQMMLSDQEIAVRHLYHTVAARCGKELAK